MPKWCKKLLDFCCCRSREIRTANMKCVRVTYMTFHILFYSMYRLTSEALHTSVYPSGVRRHWVAVDHRKETRTANIKCIYVTYFPILFHTMYCLTSEAFHTIVCPSGVRNCWVSVAVGQLAHVRRASFRSLPPLVLFGVCYVAATLCPALEGTTA